VAGDGEQSGSGLDDRSGGERVRKGKKVEDFPPPPLGTGVGISPAHMGRCPAHVGQWRPALAPPPHGERNHQGDQPNGGGSRSWYRVPWLERSWAT
jgi:hypothetical protein